MLINRRIVVWVIGFSGLFAYIAYSYITRTFEEATADSMLREIVLNPLRMLFINNVAFAMLLYVTNLTIFSNEYAVRHSRRGDIMLHTQLTGLMISVLFSSVIIIVIVSSSLISALALDINVAFAFAYLSSYCFFYFQIFLLIYVLTEKRLVSIVSVTALFLIVLGAYYALRYSYVVEDTWLPPLLDMRYTTVSSIILAIITFRIMQKKDIICSG
jgi:hypothetical protein